MANALRRSSAQPIGNALTGRTYAQPSEDEVWLAGMREQAALHAPYAKAGPYTTTLSPAEEAQFREWVAANRIPFNPNDPVADYDMRGYWRDGQQGGTSININDGRPHYPDTYKTPYHRSFSAESRYAAPGAPTWINDHQLALPSGKVIFDERAR